MSDELKPCPFCGSDNAPHVTDCIETMVCHNIVECEDETLFWVTCSVLRGGCGAEAGYVRNKADAIAAWNARAAVTDEQFSLAVHDGRLRREVRECRDVGTSSNFFRCSSCGCEIMRCVDGWKPLYMGDVNYCPNCGAKVVAE